jgi:hypothetical protein
LSYVYVYLSFSNYSYHPIQFFEKVFAVSFQICCLLPVQLWRIIYLFCYIELRNFDCDVRKQGERGTVEREKRETNEYVEELRQNLQLAFESARKHLQRNSEIRKKRYDVGTKTTKLKEGEPVWLYNPNKNLGKCAKFTPFWKKGWVITKQIDDINYRIQNGPEQTPRVVHVDRLLPYTGDDPPMWWKQ